MKRILNIFLITVICVISIVPISAPVYAENAEKAPLVNYLTDGLVFTQDGVTRAELVSALVRLAYEHISEPANAAFADVPLNHAYSKEINLALSLGIISPAEKFNPDEKVTYVQAVKMAVSLLGYGAMAEDIGGYPGGYFSYASRTGVLLNKENNDILSADDAVNLLAKTAEADMFAVAGFGPYEIVHNASILSKVRKIEKTRGIITANSHSSLYSAGEAVRDGFAVDGNKFSGTVDSSLLGYEAEVYYKEEIGEKILCAVVPKNTDTVTLSGDECSPVVNNCITDENDKEYDIDPAFNFIYNGKAYSKGDAAKIIEKDTVILTLVDAGSDGTYETIHAQDPEYLCVTRVENGIAGKVLYDNDTPNGSINLTGDKVSYEIYSVGDAGLVKTDFETIAVGDLISYYVSEDKELYKLVICNQVVEGVVNSMSQEDNSMVVGDVEYDVNNYFGNLWGEVTPGQEQSFLLDEAGRITVCAYKTSDAMYGWIVAADTGEGLDDAVKIKMFTEEGQMEILKLADKVLVDGSRVPSDSITAESINNLTDAMRLVRFKKNGEDNRITMLDYAGVPAAGDYVYMDKSGDSNNSLIKNRGFETLKLEGTLVGMYDSTYKRTFGYYHVGGSCKFFVIPDTAERRQDEKNYKIGYGSIAGGYQYSFAAYDIDAYACAGAVVALDGGSAAKINEQAKCGIVESVVTTVDEYGTQVPRLYVASNGSITSYMVDENLQSLAASLSPGDIIRFSSQKVGYITALQKDYDFNSNSLTPTDVSVLGNAYGHYDVGWVYSVNGQYINLMPEGKTSGLTGEDIKAMNYGGTVTYIYVRTDKNGNPAKLNIRFEPLQEVSDYVTGGANADRAVVYATYNNARQIFIYRFN